MKPGKKVKAHPLETWRCRHCGFTYDETEYLLPIHDCPKCGAIGGFERITEDREYHPNDDLMILP